MNVYLSTESLQVNNGVEKCKAETEIYVSSAICALIVV